MSIIGSIYMKYMKFLTEPRKIIKPFGKIGGFNWLPDDIYLKLLYWCEVGQKLNLKSPSSYNEKIQWLKLYNRTTEYVELVDKYAVRSFVKDLIGSKYLIPLIGVYNSVEEIDWRSLPNKFVLKCTHASGTNIICNNKENLDINDSIKKLKKWMNINWYWFGREWPYKNVKPRIVCEQYMVDESGTELKDYKIFCFNGEPKLIQVDFGRFTEHRRNLYTPDWEFVNASIKYPNQPSYQIPKPQKLSEMLEVAKKLSQNIPHVRIDLYSIHDKIYFGEMTFFHGSGFERFYPEEFNLLLGSWIKLPIDLSES